MPERRKPTIDRKKSKGDFRLVGQVNIEEKESMPSDLKLVAYVFDSRGQILGSGDVGPDGKLNVSVNLSRPTNVEVVIGPDNDPQMVRKSPAFSLKVAADEWKGEGTKYRLSPNITLKSDIWKLLLTQRICVSGHVRKIHIDDGITEICPVPFVKVEIFDVDREFCWWPYIKNWWPVLADRPLFRIPELLKEPPFPPRPFPVPDPIGPIARFGIQPLSPVETVGFNPQPEPQVTYGGINPQPEPPGGNIGVNVRPAYLRSLASLGPQPEPPDMPQLGMAKSSSQRAFLRVGETRLIDETFASRLDNLTLTAKLAPWIIFPGCFYSRQLVCETTTDENGYFRCCFNWWPFHFRRGRLRFDSRPDIIIRVTQIIDGVETVIYLDPYTSTRWNITNAHIDLWLDDEEVQCGSGDEQSRPEGAQVFLTRIGDDEIYKINQGTGLYNSGGLTNVAYGKTLLVYGQFGDSWSDGSSPSAPYHYRLSYASFGSPASAFTPVTLSLTDTRVNKTTNFSEKYNLGPKTVSGEPALYEVRDFENFLWYNPDWIGTWYSLLAEVDTGKYILRLELFDNSGNKLTSSVVDYRDGTAPPNGVLPPMTDSCDLVITLDNKAPLLELNTPATNVCGVIPFSSVPPLNFQINVTQENNRLRYWRFEYTKGIEPPPPHTLDWGVSGGGSLSPVSKTIDGAASPTGVNMLQGVTTTCAFALKLLAWPHIRNGRNFVYYREIVKAIAIEKCPPSPQCQ